MAFRFIFQPIAFSAVFGAAEAVEQEANCLLQSHRKQHKQLPLSAAPTLLQTSIWQTVTHGSHDPEADTAHKHGSAVLFDQLAALAEQDSRLNPNDSQMVDQVAVMLEEVSIPALHTAHESDQQQVVRVASEVSSCDNEREIVAQSPGGLDSQEPELAAARDAHRQCRQSEQVMHTAVATDCGELDNLLLNLSPPDPTPPQPQVPSSLFSEYLRVNDDFFSNTYLRYLELSGNCANDQTAASPMQVECTQFQQDFEQKFCIHSRLAEATCGVYNTCRTARESEFAATRASVEHLAMSRKLEYVTLMKIKCLIRYLLRQDAQGSEIAPECGTLRLEIHYDGSEFDPGMFNITFPSLPDTSPCASGPTSPCDTAFRVAEYSGLQGLDACSACGQSTEILAPAVEAPQIANPQVDAQPSLLGLAAKPALAALQMWAGNISARVVSAAATAMKVSAVARAPEELEPPSKEKALGIVLEALG